MEEKRLFAKKDPVSENMAIDMERIPHHIAIIMDGNGRWAQKRHLPRVAGHKQGMQTVKTITIAASNLGVKVLTLYAFSTENWKRPSSEVNYLMQLPIRFFSTFVPDLVKNNVRVMVMGDIQRLPAKTQQAVNDAVADTANCDGMVLNFALNYGSRDEITRAVQEVAAAVQAGTISPEAIDEELVSQHLMTAPLGEFADPDLLIRTSGEERISNFLLWQLAYSELEFVPEHWPDFDAESLKWAIIEFQGRHRRFGGLKNE
ncbi:MAG: isoprenyl transferase [Limosilactobacillus oris]|jgi:undecaprenyl diphosphate synthase|uniref:isoprenyl transferase n=1 Tax=Limosilactobacillus oris TaxID=1632 RepID=UPI00242CD4DD|nr:isoprenyl transferase [Limosilactobacillus oris]MCH3911865.1 isoprenyl transferase [Limosilactobacillus oris]MCH3939117.1 isoprenyl transferase [Limosilactobacillus oris]MCI1980482.1 isoprenyl transferase [Limosilactobacillus oris]MCI2042839.1 isoprenyl transferase [Limosilactobacillus oris]